MSEVEYNNRDSVSTENNFRGTYMKTDENESQLEEITEIEAEESAKKLYSSYHSDFRKK